ncbi:MAG TPA: prepilin-type N-terminal cleavage/methylation domain-containing protein [Gemmatimonadales bacterium]|nr:prepilin-type N-terminal cleavage/methylation domain-containing protein [Gemmatimonadales bacterium]
MSADRRGPGGFTLIELLVAMSMSSIVLMAAFMLLRNNQRYYRSQSQIVDVQQNIRAAISLLPNELRELSAAGGDIEDMSATSITIHAPRNLGFTCRPSDVSAGYVYLRNSLLFGYRSIDPERDYVYVFRDGDSSRSQDDYWIGAKVSATASATCADGAAATRLTITNADSGLGKLDSVSVGSPVRTYERVAYSLYEDGGRWWLGVSSFVSGSWTARSPVAGPLRPGDGLTFAYYDSAGSVTATRANVQQIQVTVRGRSSQIVQIRGSRSNNTYYEDSLSTRVFLRNN